MISQLDPESAMESTIVRELVVDPEGLTAPSRYTVEEKSTHEQRKPIHHHLSMSVNGETSPLLKSKYHLHPPIMQDSSWCSPFKRAWTWYEGQIEKRPLTTKCLTAGIITGLGDLTSQCLTLWRLSSQAESTPTTDKFAFSGAPGIDWYRSWVYFLLGFLLQAPLAHLFYAYLDAALPPTPSPCSGTTLAKLCIDQLGFAPSFLVIVFLFLDTVQHGLSPAGIVRHIQDSFCSTLVANWKLWTPATLVNFVMIQPRYRVLFCNAVFFLWSIILSMLLN